MIGTKESLNQTLKQLWEQINWLERELPGMKVNAEEDHKAAVLKSCGMLKKCIEREQKYLESRDVPDEQKPR